MPGVFRTTYATKGEAAEAIRGYVNATHEALGLECLNVVLDDDGDFVDENGERYNAAEIEVPGLVATFSGEEDVSDDDNEVVLRESPDISVWVRGCSPDGPTLYDDDYLTVDIDLPMTINGFRYTSIFLSMAEPDEQAMTLRDFVALAGI